MLGRYGKHLTGSEIKMDDGQLESMDFDAERALRETRKARVAIPAAAQAFVRQLCERDPSFEKGGRIQLSGGGSLDTLAVDPERGLAVILVDADRWVRDPGTWQHSLAQHNQARLQGWRLIRVPRSWLESPQGEELIEQLVAD